jgi:hypothetical protein
MSLKLIANHSGSPVESLLPAARNSLMTSRRAAA